MNCLEIKSNFNYTPPAYSHKLLSQTILWHTDTYTILHTKLQATEISIAKN